MTGVTTSTGILRFTAVLAHLAELIPHAGYVDVAAAGHMVAGDQNDEFNAVIREFLASSCGSA